MLRMIMSITLDAIGTGNEVYNHQYPKNLETTLKQLVDSIHLKQNKIHKVSQETQPDVTHILQFQHKISCSIIDGRKEMNIP
jgi:hypothetical protein